MRARKCWHCGENIDIDIEEYAVLWLNDGKELSVAFLHEKCSEDPKFKIKDFDIGRSEF